MAHEPPFEYYRVLTDEFVLPNGTVVPGRDVHQLRQRWQDSVDAAQGYDPYNHVGRKFFITAERSQ